MGSLLLVRKLDERAKAQAFARVGAVGGATGQKLGQKELGKKSGFLLAWWLLVRMGLDKIPIEFLCTSIACSLYLHILNGTSTISSGSTGVKLKMLPLFSTDPILIFLVLKPQCSGLSFKLISNWKDLTELLIDLTSFLRLSMYPISRIWVLNYYQLVTQSIIK